MFLPGFFEICSSKLGGDMKGKKNEKNIIVIVMNQCDAGSALSPEV